MKIGFIGFGETAYHLALGLYRDGVRSMCAYDVLQQDAIRGRQIRSRAKQCKAELKETAKAAAQWADLLFITVPSSQALQVAGEIKDCLRRGKLYVDISSATPDKKEEIWKKLRDTGVYFVDAAALGSVIEKEHRVPITASGNGAELFEDSMMPYHMDITVVGQNPGTASAVKSVCSGFMKGLAGITREMEKEARNYGVADEAAAFLRKSWEGGTFESCLNLAGSGDESSW